MLSNTLLEHLTQSHARFRCSLELLMVIMNLFWNYSYCHHSLPNVHEAIIIEQVLSQCLTSISSCVDSSQPSEVGPLRCFTNKESEACVAIAERLFHDQVVGRGTNTGLRLFRVRCFIDITSHDFHNRPVTWFPLPKEKIQLQKVM